MTARLGTVGLGTALLALLVCTTLLASTQDIYVADPGKSFGPFKIGDMPPPFWDFSCQDSTLDIVSYYYFKHGMEVSVPNSTLSQELRVDEGTIITLDVYAPRNVGTASRGEPKVWVRQQSRTCTSSRGRVVTTDIAFRPPSTVTYVSNKGVGFGASVGRVLAAHGAPRWVGTYQGGRDVSSLDYCGIVFGFDSNGRVEDITVRHPKLCRR